jgi:hypothetical protein
MCSTSGEGEEGGTHRLHAEVVDDSQYDAETSDALAADGGTTCLDLKTVADIPFLTQHAVLDDSDLQRHRMV